MYLLPIGVPLFRDGERLFVQSDWRRALVLLRDSLGGRYGDLVLLSPWLPTDHPQAREQQLTPLGEVAGVRAELSHDQRARARTFLSSELPRIVATLRRLLPRARVVHGGLDELFRPLGGTAFAMADARSVPTVFVQDTDVVLQVSQLAKGAAARARARAYALVYERLCRTSVARADLSLLKGGTLAERYRSYAHNLMVFEDSSFLTSEIVPWRDVEARLASLADERPLRLVYCGRLIARKGLDVSLRILARARALGARVELDVIGAGSEEGRLVGSARSLGLSDVVRFAGSAPYDQALLARLGTFDALLFTPSAEDTPRMIFDGYAAGLPLVASPIAYVVERARAEQATVVLPADEGEAAQALLAIDRHRDRLHVLSRKAHEAAHHHAADAWYGRRAELTHAAVERRLAASA